jgi:hypothetical protein
MWQRGNLANTCPSTQCSNYNEKGHLSKDFPKDGKTTKKAEPSNAKARAYALTREEANKKPEVVSGTFLLNNIHASILFDSGATVSFIVATAYTL